MTEQRERRRVKRIDSFDHTILSNKIEHSLVVEITREGGGLLIVKEHSLFRDEKPEKCDLIKGKVHLTILHPDSPLPNESRIEAEVIWVDHEYSDDHCKIGVCFEDVDEAQAEYIGNLEEWLSVESNYFLHCELEKG
jgi:hypothetical protein